MNFLNQKKNGVVENSEIFVETYILPIKVIVVGAVHIAQYLVDFAKSLNFEISIIDPRGYFASEQRFPDMKIINKWPDEAFKEIETNENTVFLRAAIYSIQSSRFQSENRRPLRLRLFVFNFAQIPKKM